MTITKFEKIFSKV